MPGLRQAAISRKSNETAVELTLCMEGTGRIDVQTGVGMLDHILTLIAFWASFDLKLSASGDLHIDAHHTVEDTGMVFGAALREAIGAAPAICRVGLGRVPMDDALADVCMDISGRAWLVWRGDELLPPVIAGEEKDLWREFFKAFAASARLNLHISFLYGKNGHHLLESAAKGIGIALAQAVTPCGPNIRSSKGCLD